MGRRNGGWNSGVYLVESENPHRLSVFPPSVLPPYLSSLLLSFLPSFLPAFLHSFLPPFLPSLMHSFLAAFLPPFLCSFIYCIPRKSATWRADGGCGGMGERWDGRADGRQERTKAGMGNPTSEFPNAHSFLRPFPPPLCVNPSFLPSFLPSAPPPPSPLPSRFQNFRISENRKRNDCGVDGGRKEGRPGRRNDGRKVWGRKN